MKQPELASLAIVIVTWNVRDLAVNALRSLYADLEASGLSADVYVVDSASTDGTPEAVEAAFPRVRLFASTENLGFGRANNVAIRQIMSAPNPPSAIYLLNPDTITQPGATRALYEALFAHERVGLVGARLSYADGSLQDGAFAFPGLLQVWFDLFHKPGRFLNGRLNGRYPRVLYDQGEPFAVDFVLGATMMLRREVVEQTGMFDERFFMYCEEIDWAWRIHEAGWQVLTVPAAHVAHLAGQSSQQVRPRSIVELWKSRLLLADKHFPAWKRLLTRLLIGLAMARYQQQSGDPALRDAYRTVQSLAFRQHTPLAGN